VRNDRGGEYISKGFLCFCREHGIHKQFTTRYTPPKKGVVERKSRTIMEMAKSMLKENHFPNDYLTEVIACATYVINICPNKSVKNMIPEEAWSGRKHSMTHMRVHECVAYAHVLDELRKNLNKKGEICKFFGYNDESKAYKLYNPLTKKVIINRDVKLIEEEAWDGNLENTINVKTCIPQEDTGELIATSNSSLVTPTPIQAQQRSQQVTPSINNRNISCSQENTTPSTKQRHSRSSTSITTSSDMSIPSFAIVRRQKFRNFGEIYEQNEIDSSAGLNSLFALFCHVDDPIYFEDAVKQEKWLVAMDEEIEEL